MARCCSMISRTVCGFSPSLFSLNGGTLGGGGEGGVPVMLSRMIVAAQHRRGAVGIRRHHQDRALAQQAVAPGIGQGHAPELVAAHVRDAVVQRQALIDEGVIGRQQIQHAAVFAQDAVDEQLHLALESGAQAGVEVGIDERVGIDACRSRARAAIRSAKLVTSDSRLCRSASMRRTCSSKTLGSFSLPCSARPSSSSSGMVLHRKNDRREASSRSLTR